MRTTDRLGTAGRPLRVAIVGAGPAAFYTAEALLKQPDLVCSIDLFNRYPAPYGLVRVGVAPDHQSIKSVTRVYERIAADERVRYFGNVRVGADLSRDDLRALYDQVVYAVGAPADRRMGIPGEDLEGSLPATAFVGWYNGNLEYRDLPIDLSHERAVVVGNGNVAVDVARILVKSPDELAKTDIADHALERLRESKVREVMVLGRRGPVQAAFTHPELKELGALENVSLVVDPDDLDLDPHSQAAVENDRAVQKILDTLRRHAATGPDLRAERRIHMRFLVSPAEIHGADGRVRALTIEKNELVPDRDGRLRAKGLGVYEQIETGLVLRAVGYRGVPLEGVPFDERTCTISNVAGRVVDPASGEPLAGEYVVGWAKRGPVGVIGTNKADAVETVAGMMSDLEHLPGIADENRGPDRTAELLRRRDIRYVSYDDWSVLDQYEIQQGKAGGRPRVKVTSMDTMLRIIATHQAGTARQEWPA